MQKLRKHCATIIQKCKSYANIVQSLCKHAKTMQTLRNHCAKIQKNVNIMQMLSKHCAVNGLRGSHDNTSKNTRKMISFFSTLAFHTVSAIIPTPASKCLSRFSWHIAKQEQIYFRCSVAYMSRAL